MEQISSTKREKKGEKKKKPRKSKERNIMNGKKEDRRFLNV